MKKLILAIESSCDETAAALVDAHGSVIGSELVSQISTHNLYGGVVPEVASRAHFEEIDAVVRTLVQKSGIDPLRDLEAVAATMGPGLIGPLLVGVSYARGIAVAWKKPFVGVHHLRGHLASALLEKDPTRSMRDQLRELSPALVLLASGGHTQLLLLEETFSATSLADTADDAAGECFDKSAKLMGLPYPGGPAIEKLARESSGGERAKAFASELPKPKSAAGFPFLGSKPPFASSSPRTPRSSAMRIFAGLSKTPSRKFLNARSRPPTGISNTRAARRARSCSAVAFRPTSSCAASLSALPKGARCKSCCHHCATAPTTRP